MTKSNRENRQPVGFRLQPATIEKLADLAAQLGTTKTSVVEALVMSANAKSIALADHFTPGKVRG